MQARAKFQHEQAQKWLSEQMLEKEQARKNQEKANHLYELKMRELDERAMQLAKAEEECRRAIEMATKDYNAAQVSFHIEICFVHIGIK